MRLVKMSFFILSISLISSLYARKMQQQPAPIQPMVKRMLGIAKQAPKANIEQSKIRYGMTTAQNIRPYQEDRFTHAKIKGKEFFAIYDGHGGDKTSSYLQKNFHKYLSICLKNKMSVDKQAFECAYRAAENYVLKNFDDGSTAVTLYINNGLLQCAWAGDSRIVLEKNGVVAFATEDHKPDRKDELTRITRAGGKIYEYGVWRINGLAISRSIGDKSAKKMGKGQIIAVPEYAEIALDSNNHFLVIASDGLWDEMDNQEVVDRVKTKLTNTSDLNAIALDLQNEAIKRGSQDNITICIVTFGELKKPEIAKQPPAPSYFTRFWNWLRGM